MKLYLAGFAKYLAFFSIFLSAAITAQIFAQSRTFRETESKIPANKPAPLECLAAFRSFFEYLKKDSNDIVSDKKSQTLWMSNNLRKVFEGYIKRSGKLEENPDFPSNATFLGVWNDPTTYSITGSRHYDFHNKLNPKDNRAIIDVLYEWNAKVGAGNNYPGERSLYSLIFIFEEGAWKLDDIYTFADEFAQAESLRSFFVKE